MYLHFLFLGYGTGKSKSEPRAPGRNVTETNSLRIEYINNSVFYCVLIKRSEYRSFLPHVFNSDVSRLTLHCKGHTQVNIHSVENIKLCGGMIANEQQPIRASGSKWSSKVINRSIRSCSHPLVNHLPILLASH